MEQDMLSCLTWYVAQFCVNVTEKKGKARTFANGYQDETNSNSFEIKFINYILNFKFTDAVYVTVAFL